jgi:hypothetical protein
VNIGNAPFPVALLKRGNDRSLQALIGGAVLHNLNIALEGKINFGKGHPQRPPLAKRRRSLLMGIVFPQRVFCFGSAFVPSFDLCSERNTLTKMRQGGRP